MDIIVYSSSLKKQACPVCSSPIARSRRAHSPEISVAFKKMPYEPLNTPVSVYRFFEDYYELKDETLFLLHLDLSLNLRVLQFSKVGSSTAITFDPHNIFKWIQLMETKVAILAHCHYGERKIRPSPSDVDRTKSIVDNCASCNVMILDHIVFSEFDYFSMCQAGIAFRKSNEYHLDRNVIAPVPATRRKERMQPIGWIIR